MVAGTIHMQMSWVCSLGEGPRRRRALAPVLEGSRVGEGHLRFRRGAWEEGACRGLGGAPPSDDVLAGKLRHRDAQSPAENGMWSFRPGSWAGRGPLRMPGGYLTTGVGLLQYFFLQLAGPKQCIPGKC